MKEFENLTVRGFTGSNVLAWRSLPVTEKSRLSGSMDNAEAHCA